MVRPFLKGKIHAVAAVGYKITLPFLIGYIPQDLTVPISIYLICLIGHFIASTFLHIHSWEDEWLSLVRKIDHIAIFLKIASTYWVFINTVLVNPNNYMLYCLFGGALLGILSRICYTDAPPVVVALPYIIVGWSILLDLDCLNRFIYDCPELFRCTITAGLMYTIGAVIYSARYPNPYPKVVSFHELFHIFSTIGTICITYGIFTYAIPYHKLHNQ